MRAEILRTLASGEIVRGKHLVLTAHPDDETISMGGALCLLEDAVIVQVTTGVHRDDPDYARVVDRRQAERRAAFAAARWGWPVVDLNAAGREAMDGLGLRTALLAELIGRYAPDAIWTHPYEGGHLDHDSAAWMGQHVATTSARPIARLEFASYFSTARDQVFGRFWPDDACPALEVPLSPFRLARKRAAIAAYESQASILRKFKTPEIEAYRAAPVYNFAAAPPPPRCRWDVKGYTPTSADWRRVVAEVEVAA